jgi:hypothetical protein
MKAKKPQKKPAESYRPKGAEVDAMQRHLARQQTQSAIRVTSSTKNGHKTYSLDHEDKHVGEALLYDAFSTADKDFVHGLILQLANGGWPGHEVDDELLNFMLSVIKGGKANDQFEAMLMAQMATVHVAAMRSARELEMALQRPLAEFAERTFSKLTRTFVSQLEALKRYRAGGEQKITVQHVSVNEGGQAIVGNVTSAPREKGATNLVPAIPDAKSTPMPPIREKRERASIAAVKRK